jgi:hypothetical protein
MEGFVIITLFLVAVPFLFNPSVAVLSEEQQCVACPSGTFSDCGIFNCATCTPGYCPSTSTCVPCPAGTYSASPGSTACTPCSPGYVASNRGSSKCMACPPGTQASLNGLLCQPCTPGWFNPQQAGQCTLCPPGTFSNSTKSTACEECPIGIPTQPVLLHSTATYAHFIFTNTLTKTTTP